LLEHLGAHRRAAQRELVIFRSVGGAYIRHVQQIALHAALADAVRDRVRHLLGIAGLAPKNYCCFTHFGQNVLLSVKSYIAMRVMLRQTPRAEFRPARRAWSPHGIPAKGGQINGMRLPRRHIPSSSRSAY